MYYCFFESRRVAEIDRSEQGLTTIVARMYCSILPCHEANRQSSTCIITSYDLTKAKDSKKWPTKAYPTKRLVRLLTRTRQKQTHSENGMQASSGISGNFLYTKSARSCIQLYGMQRSTLLIVCRFTFVNRSWYFGCLLKIASRVKSCFQRYWYERLAPLLFRKL